MWWECNEDYAMGGVAMAGIVNRFPAFFPDQDLARLARHLHLGHASFFRPHGIGFPGIGSQGSKPMGSTFCE